MTKYLYFDGACGISGDMTIASLLDLGAGREKLDRAIQSLNLDGFHYHIERKSSYSISGLDFDVHLHHHDLPHEESYGEHHHHEHRHLSDVYAVIDRADMSEKAKNLAKKISKIVAEAEAQAHGVPVEEVHFHEVGALDSIADIIGASVLLDDLNIEKVVLRFLCEGTGTIQCQHGALPVPVPAVLNIAEKYRIPLKITDNTGEMVTPTGIAIMAALQPEYELPITYTVLKSGIGLGKRDFGHANFLRTMIIEDVQNAKTDLLYMVESNIDDSTAEELGLVMEKLFEVGAYDVFFEPCYMKKNRPAYTLRALVPSSLLDIAEETIFRFTTTIGIRRYPVERTCMQRKKITVHIEGKPVEVKVSTCKDIVRCQPEYESVKKVASETGSDFNYLFAKALVAAEEQLKGK
jgi:uncharacterized protein (TIGR00299 family) protein